MKQVTCLAGGVGGARMADGFYQVLPPDSLAVVVNTADDFEHLGLTICPDLDTVLYTLADLGDEVRGWGLRDETLEAHQMLEKLGGPTWFLLSDQDIGLHLFRSHRLRQGEDLSRVSEQLSAALGVRARLQPMCDQPVRTRVRVAEGWLDFQEYFVRRRHSEPVLELDFQGIDKARFAGAETLAQADLIVFCPSNPFVSLGPILEFEECRRALQKSNAPRVAVSPILGGQAVKGPAASMLASLGHEVSAVGVARIYEGLIDTMVIDPQDTELSESLSSMGIRPLILPALMRDKADRARLARQILDSL